MLAWLIKLRWWIAGALAALAWFMRSGRRQDGDQEIRETLTDALERARSEEQKRREAQADADLETKRAGSTDERLRDALKRAAKRRADAERGTD